MIESIFHININCTNFERSLEFYEKLGFKIIRDLGEGTIRKSPRACERLPKPSFVPFS